VADLAKQTFKDGMPFLPWVRNGGDKYGIFRPHCRSKAQNRVTYQQNKINIKTNKEMQKTKI